MIYYFDEINWEKFDTFEEAEASVMEHFDDDEILEVMSERPHDILEELRRLDSPLYWELYEVARDRYLNEYVHETEEDEEDE